MHGPEMGQIEFEFFSEFLQISILGRVFNTKYGFRMKAKCQILFRNVFLQYYSRYQMFLLSFSLLGRAFSHVSVHFVFKGVGTVVSGTCLQGQIKTNDTLLMGPDSIGKFQLVPVKSIHRKRLPVKEVRAGQTASFALKKVREPLSTFHL